MSGITKISVSQVNDLSAGWQELITVANRMNEKKKYDENIASANTAKNTKGKYELQETGQRIGVFNNYYLAKKIHDDLYNKIYPQLQNIATTGRANAETAGGNATTAINTDNTALPKATSLNTQTSITTNRTNATDVLDDRTNVNNNYNTVYNTNNPISSKYIAAKVASETGNTAKTLSTALKNQADDLAKTAQQEKDVADEIALRARMRTDTTTFINEYINKRLVDITNTFTGFLTNMTMRETANQTILSTPFTTTPIPSGVIGNITASSAQANNTEIEGTATDKYKFINFTIDNAVSYPLKCVGTNEFSTTPVLNMELLDNNLHTFDTCKVSANLANKPYYALVKPTNSTTSNYNCYVADSLPAQNTSNYDYVTIWNHGPSNSNPGVSNFSLSTTGDFIITYTDNTTRNISNITAGIYNGRIFELVLTETGNVEIRGYESNGTYIVVWQSFSIQDVRNNMLDLMHYTSIENKNWGSLNAPFKLNAQKPSSQLLVSQNNKFKLEVTSDGKMQLKATVYGCKYTDTVNGNVSLSNTNFLYTDKVNPAVKGQPYYVYANDTRLPAIQTPYYAINAQGYQTLEQVDWSNPILTNRNEYDAYPGKSLVNEGSQIPDDGNVQTVNTENDCTQRCNNDPSCNYVFFYNGNQCYIGKRNKPEFVPNTKSNLYIRKKKMNFNENKNPFNVKPNVEKVDKNDVLRYSSYNIKSSTISSSEFIPGPPSVPNYIANSEIIKGTMDGTGQDSTSTPVSVSRFTTMNGREGFDNHGYEDPTAKYCTYPNSLGCRNAILQKQINPLSQIAQDYQNQTAQMNANEGNIDSTISQYNYYHGIMNNNNKYDFSGNQSFTMEDISIQNVMQQDTKQLLLQENNFYIAGSILTTTLLVSAIYLAR